MPTFLYYVADQDPDTTSSLGILNHSRRLLESLASLSNPGFDLVVLVSEGNRDVFVPATLPEWITVDVLPGPARGTGIRRLWSDHISVLRAMYRHRVTAVHFPKGWVPLWKPRGVRYLATIHDAITEYYTKHYPSWVRWRKRVYFAWALRHALKMADKIITMSDCSRSHLVSVLPAARGKIEVVWQAAGILSSDADKMKEGILVIGSRLPHKATRQTLTLLAKWYAIHPQAPGLRVVGLKAWPEEWGEEPSLPNVTWLGRVSDSQLADEMGRTQVLVFLSEIEGFGLPILEAIYSGAAVCYRNASSMKELMQDAPGAWDGVSDTSFMQAMDEALLSPPDKWRAVKSRLESICRWDVVAQSVLRSYRQLLESDRTDIAT